MTAEILIVDDNSDIRKLISGILKDKGHLVREAANFDQAMSEINKKLPDVAIVDVKSREVEDYILVGSRAWEVEFSKDQNTLYVANGLSDDISVINLEKNEVIKSLAVGRVPYKVLIDYIE